MADINDANLLLKLYELRTETEMRDARRFVQTWEPAGADEVIALQRDFGSDDNQRWRQVISYWEMVASFILHGVLDPDLFLDTNGEPFQIYAKYTPYLEAYAQAIGTPFMRQTAKIIEKYPAMQDRYTMMLARADARKKQASGA